MTVNTDTLHSIGKADHELLHFAGVIADPITRRIMAKLASKQSPISVDSVPLDKLEASKPQVITRLMTLEKKGVVRSENVTSQNGFCKKYFITDEGRQIVSRCMRAELNLYS